MEQRPLRLGDILDDYCPRERRVTNHAVVAMIEEDVKQTRCTTCDAEHVYKGGKAPRRKKSDSQGALYKEVLSGLDPDAAATVPAIEPAITPRTPERQPESPVSARPVAAPAVKDVTPPVPGPAPQPEAESVILDEGPVHRPLIRATLPRPEGLKDPRTPPEFTVRQSGGRGGGSGNFRGGGGGDMRAKGRGMGMGGPNGTNGGRPGGGPRFGRGPQPGRSQGQGQGHGRGGPAAGFGRGPGQPRHSGPKKRSR